MDNLNFKQSIKKLVKKTRGIVLPMVVVSMLMISMFSVLLLSFLIKSKMTTKIVYNDISQKLNYEKIYYDFKNGEDFDENENIFIYNAYNIEDKNEIVGKNIKLLMLKNNDDISLVAVYDFESNEKLAFYPLKMNISFEEDDGFEMLDYYFLPV